MSNFSIKIDCLKLKGAFLRNLQGKTTTKRCLIVPIDECDGMYLGEKGCYLSLTAIEMADPKYSDTHCIKPELSKEQREAMTEEELRNTPILGGMRAFERKQQTMQVTATIGQESFDGYDLPF